MIGAMEKMGLSVVIPAYNEEANIASCLEKVDKVLKNLKLDSEIIVVNDGSKDKTGAIAKSFIKKIKHLRVVENNPNRGYGGSLKAGFAAATKEFIAFTPADNQFDFSEVTKLIEVQKNTGADIVSGIRVHDSDPFHRKVNRWGWNTIVRALFGFLASDIDCGFKLFKRDVLDKVTLSSDGALVDTQLFAGALARGMKVAEIPVTHLPRTAGKSTGANLKVIIKAFRDLFVFWWQLRQEIMVEKGLAVFRWEVLLLVGIILVGAFLRLYRIGDYTTFLGDEGRDALVMRDIVTGRHFPLIGPGTSVGNMYLGPWYYYLIAPSLALSNLSPVGPSVMVAFIGLATIFLLWWVGRQWYGRSASLMVAALFATSPAVIFYSRSSWNPNVMPFFALLAAYGVWKLWRFGYWRWLVITAVCFAFVLNSHYLGLLLGPLLGLFFLLGWRRHPNGGKVKYVAAAAAVFLLMMSPLLWFDLRHGGQNVGAIRKFFTDRQTTVNLKAYKALPNLGPIWTDIVTDLFGADDKEIGSKLALGIAGLAAAVIVFARSRFGKNYQDLWFTLTWVGIGLVGLGLYKQHIYTHYYGFLFPAMFLLVGFILKGLGFFSRRILPVLITGGLLFLNLSHHPFRSEPNRQIARTSEVATFIHQQSGGRPFNLALLSKHNYDAPYRYYLALQDAPYATIHDFLADQLFVICESQDPEFCRTHGNPLWEIAAFGWAKVDQSWDFPWGVKVMRLVHSQQ